MADEKKPDKPDKGRWRVKLSVDADGDFTKGKLLFLTGFLLGIIAAIIELIDRFLGN